MNDGSLRRLKALIIKEFTQMIRDPSSIMIAVILPLILLFIYGFGVSLDANNIKIGLVLEDSSPDAQSFAKSLANSKFLDVTIGRHKKEFEGKMMEGSIRGVVVIPSYFSTFRKRQDYKAPIQVIADGSETNTASFVQNYVQAAWLNWLQQEQISNNLRGLSLVKLQPRYWYNEQLESFYFLVPGSLAIVMTLIGTLLTALVVSREWERGTMEAMMSTPASIVELLIGKLVPYYMLGMASMAMSVAFAIIVYRVPFQGSFLTLALLTFVFLFPALGLGLLISTLSRSQIVAAQVSMVTGFLPAFILSGFIFEIASMPWIIQMITHIIPARYFVNSLQTIFLVGDDWTLLLWNMIPMLIIGTFFFIMTMRVTVKRLD